MNVHCLSGAIVTVSTNMITWTMKGGDWGRGRSNVKKQEEKMGFAIQTSFWSSPEPNPMWKSLKSRSIIVIIIYHSLNGGTNTNQARTMNDFLFFFKV